MRIDFPLLSILSVGFLLFFAFQGGDVQLHSIEVGFSADSQGVTVTVDPEWLVWADRLYPASWLGETFGNVSVVQSKYRGTKAGAWITEFELNHIKQYRALGWWNYPLGFILPIDPQPTIIHWYDPFEPDRIEWLPPAQFFQSWHFLTLSSNLCQILEE